MTIIYLFIVGGGGGGTIEAINSLMIFTSDAFTNVINRRISSRATESVIQFTHYYIFYSLFYAWNRARWKQISIAQFVTRTRDTYIVTSS